MIPPVSKKQEQPVEHGFVTLEACPPGAFVTPDGYLGFKTEYRMMETVGPINVPGDQVRWKVGRWPDAYVMASGEYFWGGAKTHDERAALLVRPIEIVVVEDNAGGEQ